MIAFKTIKFTEFKSSTTNLRNAQIHIVFNMSMAFVIHQEPICTKFRGKLYGKSTINKSVILFEKKEHVRFW